MSKKAVVIPPVQRPGMCPSRPPEPALPGLKPPIQEGRCINDMQSRVRPSIELYQMTGAHFGVFFCAFFVSPSAEAQDGVTKATLPLKHEVVDTPLTQGERASE